VLLAIEERQPLNDVALDMAELLSRVAPTKVVRPSPQNRFNSPTIFWIGHFSRARVAEIALTLARIAAIACREGQRWQ
jgi:hypothetical protein